MMGLQYQPTHRVVLLFLRILLTFPFILAAEAAGPGLMRLALWIAGSSRGERLRDEWEAHLAGDPETGVALSGGRRRAAIAGFVMAALSMRASDMARPVWVPVDWLLSREERTNRFISFCVGALAIYLTVTDGVHALITADWQSCAGLGGGLYVLARWLRRIRGIELAERERRRDRAS